MNKHDTLIERIDSWTQEVFEFDDELKMAAWVAACKSTKQAHKDALLDELFGETK